MRNASKHSVAMNLPSPTFAFSIPSVHDGTQLDCRIYLPRELQRIERASSWRKKGAIVAHPYAPLGGCYDDPVVSFAGGELLQAAFVVGTFNFRGAGDSDGKTSWTAKSELADYVSFYGFMLYFLHRLNVGKGDIHDSNQTTDSAANLEESSAAMNLILGGYSYGSLIASHLPTVEVVLEVFRDPATGTPMYEICRAAEKISSSWYDKLQNRMSPQPSNLRQKDDESSCNGMAPIKVSYLLISPLLPPISQLLTAFSRLSFNVGTETTAQGKRIPCPKPTEQLCSHQTLAVYGNQDAFTSAKKLEKWSGELASVPRSRFQSHEIDGAGHFWREDGVESQARSVLRDWLRHMP